LHGLPPVEIPVRIQWEQAPRLWPNEDFPRREGFSCRPRSSRLQLFEYLRLRRLVFALGDEPLFVDRLQLRELLLRSLRSWLLEQRPRSLTGGCQLTGGCRGCRGCGTRPPPTAPPRTAVPPAAARRDCCAVAALWEAPRNTPRPPSSAGRRRWPSSETHTRAGLARPAGPSTERTFEMDFSS
jgi:hypothetical protein